MPPGQSRKTTGNTVENEVRWAIGLCSIFGRSNVIYTTYRVLTVQEIEIMAILGRSITRWTGAILLLFCLDTLSAAAGEILPGPLAAEVLRVVDGDTLEVRARIWLGQDIRIRVRLTGIDTPERRGRCEGERQAAEAARHHLKDLIARRDIRLFDIRRGKFAGRVLARVRDARDRDLANEMLESGHARTYDGGRRADWCRLLADNRQRQ